MYTHTQDILTLFCKDIILQYRKNSWIILTMHIEKVECRFLPTLHWPQLAYLGGKQTDGLVTLHHSAFSASAVFCKQRYFDVLEEPHSWSWIMMGVKMGPSQSSNLSLRRTSSSASTFSTAPPSPPRPTCGPTSSKLSGTLIYSSTFLRTFPKFHGLFWLYRRVPHPNS